MNPEKALEISRRVAEEVEKAISGIAGTREAGEVVGMGKDGTPTKRIDKLAEQAALRVLGEYNVTVVSEEVGVTGEGDVYVALDPIDGTFNAEKGVPIYSVTLLFSKSRKLGDAFFGYVKNLATGEEYYSDGVKSYRNGKEIRASSTESLRCNAIVYYPNRDLPFRRVRIFGASSLEICYVADGRFDCFIDLRKGENGRGFLRVYDISASLFIAKNAGARVSSLDGDDIWEKEIAMDERFRIVVSGEKIHDRLIEMLL
ncbi:D-fructose 1,6-bisphosphatase [Geoglobus ahangari]|uniref:fructose-bisphosphatase n=1 Tax=Geoglobus ahangari TaxID=113653 RepID=A0A0F7DBK9_9EURY|nr:inositol monophosphatase family protein [Geoglobus ahangari]AKG91271.1 D-fructose 1,6-bisphosphatase [Geoglobus ahangari]